MRLDVYLRRFALSIVLPDLFELGAVETPAENPPDPPGGPPRIHAAE